MKMSAYCSTLSAYPQAFSAAMSGPRGTEVHGA
jgi:hypothetical protein